MDREKAKALLPVITAYANGETIQGQRLNGDWVDLATATFDSPAESYRIKPKPRTFYGVIYADGSVRCYNTEHHRDMDWPTLPDCRKLTLVEQV